MIINKLLDEKAEVGKFGIMAKERQNQSTMQENESPLSNPNNARKANTNGKQANQPPKTKGTTTQPRVSSSKANAVLMDDCVMLRILFPKILRMMPLLGKGNAPTTGKRSLLWETR